MNLKRCLCSLLAFSVFFACISGSLAEEVAPDVVLSTPEPTAPSVVSAVPSPLEIPQPFQVEVTLLSPEVDLADSAPALSASEAPVDVLSDLEPGLVSFDPASVITHDLKTSGDRGEGSIVTALTAILGEYSPATYQTVTYMDGATIITTEVVPGVAGLDWPWLAGAGLFALMLFCLFKLLGGLWK